MVYKKSNEKQQHVNECKQLPIKYKNLEYEHRADCSDVGALKWGLPGSNLPYLS